MELKIENCKLKIVFMGTPKFGAIILEKLADSWYKPILVVTETDKPVGRKQILTPPPVKVVAEKYEIPVLQPERIENLKLKIENLKPDLGIVAAYGRILPNNILSIPKYGFINVHPSFLPQYRGSSPIQTAILNGERKTGVTIMLVNEKIDRGPILTQRETIIEEDETGETLHDKLVNLGARLLLETIPKWQRGLIKPQSQDENKATYSKVLSREDGKINWKKPAEQIERQIRAFSVWPESFTFWKKTDKLIRIKILKARIKKSIQGIAYPLGKTLVVPQNEIAVQCGGGFLGERGDFLVIEKLQLEGKKEIAPEEFIRGYPDFIGTILE